MCLVFTHSRLISLSYERRRTCQLVSRLFCINKISVEEVRGGGSDWKLPLPGKWCQCPGESLRHLPKFRHCLWWFGPICLRRNYIICLTWAKTAQVYILSFSWLYAYHVYICFLLTSSARNITDAGASSPVRIRYVTCLGQKGTNNK